MELAKLEEVNWPFLGEHPRLAWYRFARAFVCLHASKCLVHMKREETANDMGLRSGLRMHGTSSVRLIITD
jgi:hypothetical protein